MSAEAEGELRSNFELGLITRDDIKIIKRWIVDVEEQGLNYAQSRSDWRDHELDGRWKNHRAISFSYMGRVIYRVENEKVIVMVVRITADHDYKK